MIRRRRRVVIGLVAIFALLLTQCGGDTGQKSDTSTIPGSNTATGEDDTGTGAGDAAAPANVEPYADVSAVTATGSPAAYSLAVTIESADIDCSQYADWWEVIDETGALVFRRILAHSHTDANGTGNPFTRDGSPVDIAEDQTVVVRAHMNLAGYVGKAMRGSVAEGFTDAPDVGPEFARDVEDDDPQPGGCLF
jgi:hypothetical protein